MSDDTNENPPSVSLDPAVLSGGMAGMLRFILRKWSMTELESALPAVVTGVDGTGRKFVSARPLIQQVTTSGKVINRPEIAKLPILQLSGGDFVLSFPVAVGDIGWIVACDRDISLAVQNFKDGKDQPPGSQRHHDFRDAFFIPDAARKWASGAEGAPANAVALQSKDGTMAVWISPDSIKLKHPTLVEIAAPAVRVTGTVTATNFIVGASSFLSHIHPVTFGSPGSTGATSPPSPTP